MNLLRASADILDQLVDLVENITDADFCRPSAALSGSTIGQHLRHTLEFFLCFESGFETGLINYDKRNHDKAIETDRSVARITILRIREFLDHLDISRPLTLEVSYSIEKEDNVVIDTNSARELVYNIEHAVHHMALMKIGIREIAPYILLDRQFGVASSTLRYRENNTVKSE